MNTATSTPAILAIAGLSTLGVILRPWQLPEAIWALAGALLLVCLGLLTPAAAWHGVMRGQDVYLFLIGMMALAEIARKEGLFDWLAQFATAHAKGSASRLFALVYAVGIVVTVFLSNDATAVVLTPAVYAAAKAARAQPMPYLLICAFIANAASFVLPISNPANLVVYAAGMPPLLTWLAHFTLPSLAAIAATFVVLRWTQRATLRQPIAREVEAVALTAGGRLAGLGIIATAIALLAASALHADLGLPACIAGILTVALVLAFKREAPWPVLRDISWSVLALVAGLFVLIEALGQTNLLQMLADRLAMAAHQSVGLTAWGAGLAAGFGTNLVNNLPAGLVAGATVQHAALPSSIAGALLIGIDLGPNLSVTGSLATILWLTALRREGLHVSALSFLKLGILVMPPALVLAIAAFLL